MSDVPLNLPEWIGRPRIPLSKIDAVVSEHLGPARVHGNAQPNVLYRHIAMYLAKHVGGWSTTRIGKFYHGRDHSTVCYAIRRIESLRRRDSAVDALILTLTELCQQDTEKRPNPTASVFKKIVRDHLDDALMEELIDRIADRIVWRLQLGTSTLRGCLKSSGRFQPIEH
ncbi:MAG: helix-turn-helix domain-containing protein [Bryobacteraceae bacterium]